jgi:hypothetical protein
VNPHRARFDPRSPPPPWQAFVATFWPFVLGTLLIAGGLVAIVIGWIGASGTVYVGLQIPYLLSGGLLGLALVVLGSALMIVHVLARQARLTRRLLAYVEFGVGLGQARETDDGSSPAGPGTVLVVEGGARWYHRPGCLLVQGKSTERMSIEAALARTLNPCRVCDPPAVPAPETTPA